MVQFLTTYLKGDRAIWILMILLSIISLLSVYSAAGALAFRYREGNASYYLIERAVFLLLGLLAMYMAHRIPFRVFSILGVLGLYATIPLLLLTLLMGSSINDASRWLQLPFLSVSIQTSDLAKLSLLLFLARKIGQRQAQITDFKRGFLPLAIPVSLVCLLILPANFSTAAMLFFISALLMIVGGVALKHILGWLGLAAACFALIIALAFAAPQLLPRLGTWKARVENFFSDDPADSYQVEQAKMSIASGGLLGTGPGNNPSKYRLPQSYSDFIYANIVGEYGLLFGGLVTMLGYLVLLYRSIKIGSRTESAFGTFTAYGLGLALVIQAFINMAVAVNLLPVTGQPLPWISMGGTSTIITGLTIGIILSIGRGEKVSGANKNQPAEEGQLNHA